MTDRKDRLYQGSEVIITEAKMFIKAYIDALLISLFVQLIIFLVIVQLQIGLKTFFNSLIGYLTAWLFETYKPSHQIKFCNLQGLCAMFASKEALGLYTSQITFIMRNYIYKALIGSAISYIVTVPLLLKIFRARAVALNKERVIRGRDMVKERQLVSTLPKPRRLPISRRLFLPIVYEPQHILITGKPGMGKTTLISQETQELRDEGQKKVIIYDYKGDYIQKFYRPGIDYLFNPLDSRCLKWTLFNDMETIIDIENIASSLVPPAEGEERFWQDTAKTVLVGILRSLVQDKALTNADIWRILSMQTDKIQKYLFEHNQSTAAKYITSGSGDAKQATSVISTLLSQVSVFEHMTNIDGDFSFKDWLESDDDGWLFLVNRADSVRLLRPILTLAIDILARQVLTMPDDIDRRVFFFVDEIGTLQKMTSLQEFLTNARSKGGVLIAGIQDLAQIATIYGREFAYITFLNNFANLIIFGIEGEMAETIAKSIGQKEVESLTKQYNFGPDRKLRDSAGVNKAQQTKQIILSSELSSLKRFEVFVRLAEGQLTKTKIRKKFINNTDTDIFVMHDDLYLKKEKGGDVNVETNSSVKENKDKKIQENIETKQEKQEKVENNDENDYDFLM